MNKKIFQITSTTSNSECWELWKLASCIPPESVLVEIGTGAGRTTAILADAVAGKGSIVYTVDNYSCVEKYGEYGWDAEVAKKNLLKLDLHGHTRFLIGESAEVAKAFVLEIDFLFIDGPHSYKGVCIDMDSWCPKVRKGGIISGHDFNPNCSDGRNVIKAIFDKLILNPTNQRLDVRERIWWLVK